MDRNRVEVAFVLGMENRKKILNLHLCKNSSNNIQEMCIVLQYLLDKADIGDENTPRGYVSESAEDMSKELGLSVDGVKSALRGLCSNYCIKRSERYGYKIY